VVMTLILSWMVSQALTPNTLSDKQSFITPLMRAPWPYVASHLQSRNPAKYSNHRRLFMLYRIFSYRGSATDRQPIPPWSISTTSRIP
jgi:hypothetical protein